MSITKASLIDLNGQELILDADADTSITADTDDQIDIKIAGSDSIRIKANEIENVSGDFTLDVAGNIILDADGGDILLHDAGTAIGQFALNNSGFFDIFSAVSDADIRIRGNDGGSSITALTLDMSSAGAATFNAGATFGGRITATSNHSQLTLTDSDDSKFVLISYSGGKYILRNNSTDTSENQFTLTEDGKFGIGTTSPGGLPLQTKVASGDNKFRQTTAAKDAFTLGLDNSTGDTIIGTHTTYPALRVLDAGGLCFGSDTAAANALDDYEEGTFDATIIAESGSITVDTSDNLCFYTKIGRLVTVSGRISPSSISNPSGQLYVGNLPFALASAGETSHAGAVACNIYNAATNFGGQVVAEMTTTGSARILIRGNGGTTSAVHTAAANIDSGSLIGFTATYPAT